MFDTYEHKRHRGERLATRPGAGLPDHVSARDWTLMPAGLSQIMDDVEDDIAARGFSYFQML
jgi:hypothetical protein